MTMLDPEGKMTQHERESALLNSVRHNQEIVDNLCLLNDALNLRVSGSVNLR